MRRAQRPCALRGDIIPSFGKDDQALELMFVGQAALEAALEALEALALMLSKTLGLISLALELVLSSAQDCQVLSQTVALVALEALEALALVLGSTLGLISLALALLPAARRTARRWSSCSSARRWRLRRSRRWRACSAARWA